jgi:hypothetical protein
MNGVVTQRFKEPALTRERAFLSQKLTLKPTLMIRGARICVGAR